MKMYMAHIKEIRVIRVYLISSQNLNHSFAEVKDIEERI